MDGLDVLVRQADRSFRKLTGPKFRFAHPIDRPPPPLNTNLQYLKERAPELLHARPWVREVLAPPASEIEPFARRVGLARLLAIVEEAPTASLDTHAAHTASTLVVEMIPLNSTARDECGNPQH
jgi:hypothetical protein